MQQTAYDIPFLVVMASCRQCRVACNSIMNTQNQMDIS